MHRAHGIAFLALFSLLAHAGEGSELEWKARALAAEAARKSAQPVAVARDALPQLLDVSTPEVPLGAGCTHSPLALCYDIAGRHLVLGSARRFMPALGGLRPESVALRRNAIVLRYTFR